MAVFVVQSATAGSITGQQIIATFTGISVAGTIANSPEAGTNSYLDNSATAAYNVSNNVVNNNSASSSLSWGTYSGTLTGFQTFSLLVFVGNLIPSTHETAAFNLGSLTFLNGTSDLGTLIFGAQMNFYAGSISATNYLGTDSITVTTTSNIFNVPGGVASGDDDYVNICGPLSGICGTSIEAVESSEGGTGLVVNLFGKIVGDPVMSISSVDLAGTQSPTTNGFLGSDPAIGAQTPEPASWALITSALVLGFTAVRRRRGAH